MTAVTISPKYQVVLPEFLRRSRDYKPGMKVAFIDDGESVRFVPVQDMKSLRGFIKGKMKPSDFQREEIDRDII